ncbi:hypothetical protein ACZ87_03201 [Candidatus Erwinia dacicola]|uniref:Uncharacterized protein n=1 Tax=Candidatus Erwinia dacicola TaxID=252393 RepID=A0A328TKZ8_9GAMM|nr:hypothetical protein ACZ87_03201 [Candidatus Erwinia dacicola]
MCCNPIKTASIYNIKSVGYNQCSVIHAGMASISSDMKYAYFTKAREILSREAWWV